MKEVEQQPTPLRTILQNFLNHVENLDRLSDDSYDKEFQSLKLFSESLKSIKHYACTEGEKEVNKKKNRYKDILPFDYTRVILSGIPGVQGSDYVNANFIKGASGSLAYIASQGPLPHTANDFWRMVVECEVQVIVMACNEEESGKHKCEHYWTDNEGEEKQFGIASIRLVKASVVCPDFLVRTMQLKYNKNDIPIERTVCQFHYSAWPDHGVPPLVRPLLDMVRLVRDTQASETLPVLIHCSAGCGRTGTICAIDYVWGLLRAGKLTRDFSLLKLVRDMRKQRIAMVQTKDQYVLVHKAVRELFQEQLKMIDAHPYENVDLNGVSLVQNEPLYEQLKASDVSEKQDNKEKESLKEPDRKRETAPASKQEKEVENQTQKQLASFCVVDNASSADSGTDSSVTLDKTVEIEQTPTSKSSLLQKPRIAKLKALFERSPNSKSPKNRSSPKTYDETDFHKARPSQQVTRSHSLGAVRKPSKFSQFQSASETPVALYRKLFSSDSKKTTPEVEQSQLKRVTEENGHDQKPALPVKRSKSLKVIGTSQAKSKSTLQQQLCSLLVDDVPPVASSSQVTNDRFQYCNGSGTKEYVNISELRQPTKKPLSKSQSAVQLPAQNDNDVRKPLDGGMQKIVSECRKYLMGSQDPPEPDTRQFDSLSVEAQRKINNIVGGIGIRERRNSFRKAVCHDSTDKRKDYEPIWLPDDTVHNHNGHHPGRFNAIQSPGRTIDSATHNPSRPNDDKFLSLHSNSSLSSSGTSSNSGKRLLEFEKPADQRSHLHQRALAQAMHSGVSRTPNRHPPAAMFPDPTKIDHLQYNSPAYRNVTEPYGMIQQQQHRAGPLAPPRTKRHHRNSMIETASPNKDPIYANTTQIKASKDEWHGALGVDVDSVAASMKQTPTQTESSLTRAFEKLSTKASNMRTKLSPKFEAESPSHKNMQPNPDTRQQGARPSPRVSHPVKKQQQYL